MTSTNGAGLPTSTPLILEELEATVNKLRGMPASRWLLMAPDGRVFIDGNPAALIRVLCLHGGGSVLPDLLRESKK